MDNDEFNPGEILKDFADKAEEKAQEVSADIEQKAEEAKEAAEEKAEALEEAAEDMVEKAEDFAEEAKDAAEEKAEAVEEAVEDLIDDAEDDVTVTLETLMEDEPEDEEEDRLEKPGSSRKPSIPQYVPKTYARDEKVSETYEFSDEPEEDVLEPVSGRVAGVRATLNAKDDKSSKTVLWIILAVLVCLCVGGCCLVQAFLAILRAISRM